MSISLVTKGMISSSIVTTRNIGNIGALDVEILCDEYCIEVDSGDIEVDILYD